MTSSMSTRTRKLGGMALGVLIGLGCLEPQSVAAARSGTGPEARSPGGLVALDAPIASRRGSPMAKASGPRPGAFVLLGPAHRGPLTRWRRILHCAGGAPAFPPAAAHRAQQSRLNDPGRADRY